MTYSYKGNLTMMVLVRILYSIELKYNEAMIVCDKII